MKISDTLKEFVPTLHFGLVKGIDEATQMVTVYLPALDMETQLLRMTNLTTPLIKEFRQLCCWMPRGKMAWCWVA
jgi:hypothetical protein